MGNLMTSFNAGVSGLKSAQTSLTTTAHNVSNAQTKGYTRQQVIITDSFYSNTMGEYDNLQQVGTGTVITKTRQIRNDFLDSQYRLQVGRQGFYEINKQTVYEIEDMLGELQGEQFQNNINGLENALSELAADPSDIVRKEEVVSKALQFIDSASVLQEELTTYQTSLNQEILLEVNTINDLVSQIKDLNIEIQRYEATGDSANDYRDKRNECLDQLGKYISFDVQEERDGTVIIYSEGRFLLDTANQYELKTAYESDTSKLLKPVWGDGENYFLNSSLEYSSEKQTDVGSLRGIMVARGNEVANYTDIPTKPTEDDFKDENGVVDTKAYVTAMNQYQEDLETYNQGVGASTIMSVQARLDALVHGIVTSINDILCPNKEITLEDGTKMMVLDEENAWIGDDKDKTLGTELFSRRARSRYEQVILSDVNGVPYKDKDGNDLVDENGEPLKVYKYVEEDESDIYSLYTLSQLVINPTVLQDSSTIPTMYGEKSDYKNQYAYDGIEKLANCFNNNIGTLDPNSLTTYTAHDYYQALVGELAIQGNIWTGIVENQENTVTSLENERQDVMGVSTDEELSDLIKFQRCYDASSRYITTISEMLEYLIERLGG